MQNFRRIIVLSPHTDDGELGCGGTIARFIEEGRDVHYCVFSNWYDVKDPRYTPDQPEGEMRSAMRVFGVPDKNIHITPFPVRHFTEHRQQILQVLWGMSERLKPDLVIMPRVEDLHQDHSTIAMEGMRAFKKTSILCYEQPWNTLSFATEAFISLKQQHIDLKLKALACYESQNDRDYLNHDVIIGWARTRGVQVGAEFAECFEVPRLVF